MLTNCCGLIRLAALRSSLSYLSRSASYVQGKSSSSNIREYFYYIDHQGGLFLDDTKVKNFITCFKDKKFLAFFFRRLRVNDTGQYQDAFPFVSPCGKELNYIRCEDLPLVFTHLLDEQGDVIKDIGSHAEQLHHTAGKCDSKQPSSNIRNHDYKQPSPPPPSPPLDFKTQLTDRIDDRNQPPANTDRNHDRSKNPSHRLTRVSLETLSYGGAGSALTIPFQPEKLCMLPGNGRVYHIGLEIVGGVGLVSSSLGIELSPFFRYEDGSDPERDSPVRFAWRGRDYELDNSVLKILEQRSPQS